MNSILSLIFFFVFLLANNILTSSVFFLFYSFWQSLFFVYASVASKLESYSIQMKWKATTNKCTDYCGEFPFRCTEMKSIFTEKKENWCLHNINNVFLNENRTLCLFFLRVYKTNEIISLHSAKCCKWNDKRNTILNNKLQFLPQI